MEPQSLKSNKIPVNQRVLDGHKDDTTNYEDIEGQDQATVHYDGNIKINMKEELESGYFNADGNYFFNKVADNKDEWLDNLDNLDNAILGDGAAGSTLDRQEVYKQVLELMKPSETVMGALKRLGGTSGHLSASGKWLGKSKINKIEDEFDLHKFLRLAELADSLVQAGDVELYGDTFEKLEFLTGEKKTQAQILDMFFR